MKLFKSKTLTKSKHSNSSFGFHTTQKKLLKPKRSISHRDFYITHKKLLKSTRSNSCSNFEINTKTLAKSKHSQMKIMEMSFMLLALFFFFMLVGMFFLIFYVSDLKIRANILYNEGTINTLAGLAGTPEFSCGEPACVDMDKVVVLRTLAHSTYKNFWNIGSLKVVKVYPPALQDECGTSSYNDCKTITLKEKNRGTNENLEWAFISLCRKELSNGISYDKCEIGRIIAGTEEKQ